MTIISRAEQTKRVYQEWRAARKESINKLQEIKQNIHKSKNDDRRWRIGISATGVAAGAAALVAGACTWYLGPGAIAIATGASALVGLGSVGFGAYSDYKQFGIEQEQAKMVEKALQKDDENSDEFVKEMRRLRDEFYSLSDEEREKVKKDEGNGEWYARLIKFVCELGKVFSSTIQAVEAATKAGNTTVSVSRIASFAAEVAESGETFGEAGRAAKDGAAFTRNTAKGLGAHNVGRAARAEEMVLARAGQGAAKSTAKGTGKLAKVAKFAGPVATGFGLIIDGTDLYGNALALLKDDIGEAEKSLDVIIQMKHKENERLEVFKSF